MTAAVLDLEGVVAALARGDVVALPTDTVYGVAASLDAAQGVGVLFALKHRPSDMALPVLVDSVDQITRLGAAWPHDAQRLADRFWPGALTIVVRAPEYLARRVGSPTDSVGLRIPDLDLVREVLRRSGPLAVTSANNHGQPPCTSAATVLETFGARSPLAGVLDGGVRDGAVSTVVDLTGPQWRVLREGAIATSDIADALS